ncbi:MAG: hypothetical protein CVT48_04330 [Thermoplasmata archaeon HGW-Thermoplasmata-1]|nr:MAG: hypothetical protein CVT48_04330 [Thermoplasmata archaeon HGW-Thermoplasmata-1]
MSTNARLYFEYGSDAEAAAIHGAVAIDNVGYVNSRAERNSLIAEIKSDNLSSFINTIDDFLACLTTAENIVSGSINASGALPKP